MAASTDLRRELSALWLAALALPPGEEVAGGEAFFDAGGDSLAVIMLHTTIEERLRLDIDVGEVFDVLATRDFDALVALVSATAGPGAAAPAAADAPGATAAGDGDGVRAHQHIGERIGVLAARHPDRTAVISVRPDGAETSVTWAELQARSNAAARALAAAGVGGDDVVVVCLPNGIPHIVSTLAAWKVGALVVPVNPALPEREHAELLARVAGAHVIGGRSGSPPPADLPATAADGAEYPSSGVPRSAALTGGSTGTSRIVLRRHPWTYDPDAPAPAGYSLEGMRTGQVQLVSLPMYHGGFLETHNGLAMEHTVVVMERFSPTLFLRLVERHRVAFLVLVPTLMRAIASVPDVESFDLGSIEALYHGSGGCHESDKRRWLDLLSPERVYEDYGSIEDIGFLTIRGDEWLKHPGSVGRPSGDVTVRILDDDGAGVPAGTVGNVYVRSSRSTQPRYLGGGPPLAGRDGFLTVGDLGYLDEDGYLYLVDRRADMINVGGINVYPAEIEGVLAELPDVADVAVVGRPHDVLGAAVHAVVVPAAGSRPREQDLDAHCRGRLVRTKVPVSYTFTDRLPRDAAGKLRRRDL
ncbi:AMP-binding protein [Streptomyces sp. WMMC500]|uniref:AMP-binding protein n=1 Tax=Streptomyces sp. WMMC500 TaxID=3015154 RepID=UPI00248B7E98|nr:AMP-binding protein [Streptomyces sp. WMMC500]WBB60780.1 AMP-binding protein [Streptomyces sp. WMMC500]